MIRVNVFSDSEGNTRKIELKGHAGYDDYGKDIVCASASALVLNMANSVEQFTDDGFDGNVEEETGHFTFRFTGWRADIIQNSSSGKPFTVLLTVLFTVYLHWEAAPVWQQSCIWEKKVLAIRRQPDFI